MIWYDDVCEVVRLSESDIAMFCLPQPMSGQNSTQRFEQQGCSLTDHAENRDMHFI